MSKLYNLARMTTATSGTGIITLGAAVSGYLTFALAGVTNGEVVSYSINDGSNSEHGIGTYTSAGTTLSRTVTKSTNSNNAISLSGSAVVFILPRAEDIRRPIKVDTFTSSGTWTKPDYGTMVFVQAWGGGGSGGSGSATNFGGGAGGGGYNESWFAIGDLSATETVTIGAGGVGQVTAATAGNAGGNTTFGTKLTAYGGGGGGTQAADGAGGGGGGGTLAVGSVGAASVGGAGGAPAGGAATSGGSAYGGGGGGTGNAVGNIGGHSYFGGGAGGGGGSGVGNLAADCAGGKSVYGGGGGGASGTTNGGNAGTSVHGGAGSAGKAATGNSSAGTQPGGGSGGTFDGSDSGAGGAGKVIVSVY